LVERSIKFKRHVTSHFQWNFDGEHEGQLEEEGENGPVVVQVSELPPVEPQPAAAQPIEAKSFYRVL